VEFASCVLYAVFIGEVVTCLSANVFGYVVRTAPVALLAGIDYAVSAFNTRLAVTLVTPPVVGWVVGGSGPAEEVVVLAFPVITFSAVACYVHAARRIVS
jgi:hypothetical protein